MTIYENSPEEDIGNAEFIKTQKSTARDQAKSRTDLMAAILSLPEGRKWIWQLLTEVGTFRNPFSADSSIMAFRCGEQNVGQRIFADVLEASPAAYLQMIKENEDASSR